MQRARVAVAVAVASMATATFAQPAQTIASAPLVACQALASSGHELYCLALDIPSAQTGPLGAVFTSSHDDGKSWRRRSATGLPTTTGWRQIVLSGNFADDHTVFVQDSDAGLFASSDGGDTFRPVDPTVAHDGDLPTLAPAPLSNGLQAELPIAGPVLYGTATPALLSPPLRTPVAGVPADHILLQFLASSAGRPVARPLALAQVRSDSAPAPQLDLFSCDQQMSCVTPIYHFTDKGSVAAAHLDATYKGVSGGVSVILAPPYPTSKLEPVHIWHSSSGGKTFSRLTAAEQLAIKERGKGSRVSADIETVGSSMVLMIDTAFARAIYVSSDKGVHWKLANRSVFGSGQIPVGSDLYMYSHKLWSLPSGKLLVTGQPKNSFLVNALACSSDLGKHWGPHC